MNVPLIPILTDPPQSAESPLVARVHIADEQHTGGALDFVVIVSNESDETLVVDNPYEGLTYQLTDLHGWPIGMNAPTRNAKVRGPKPPASAKRPYVDLRHAGLDGEELEPSEVIEAEHIELEAGGELALGLRIDQVRASHDSADLVAPANSEYHLTVLLPLAWTARGTHATRLLRNADPVTITLTSD